MQTQKRNWKLYLVILSSIFLPVVSFNSRIPSHGSVGMTTNWCTNCESKVDRGEEYMCCRDCTYPEIISDDPKFSYCKSGAELFVEPKPHEVFKWVAGPWKPCSSPCDGGIRSREVDCYAVFRDTLIPDYPVYDYKCSTEEMPVRVELCHQLSCLELNGTGLQGRKNRSGMSTGTFTVLVSVVVIAAIGGIVFAGHLLWKRRRNSVHYGQVYVMMEGYL